MYCGLLYFPHDKKKKNKATHDTQHMSHILIFNSLSCTWAYGKHTKFHYVTGFAVFPAVSIVANLEFCKIK
jgi:hypothetical protein